MFKPPTCPHCGAESDENLFELQIVAETSKGVKLGTIPAWKCRACGGETVTQEGYNAHVKLYAEYEKTVEKKP